MPATLHETITDELTCDILRGHYRAGERLPSERDLAARFSTNRGAVREAIKKLEQLGLAEVQPGGARVRPLQDANLDVIGPLLNLQEIPDPDLVEQLLEAMGALMHVATSRALERASDAELDYARELLRRTLKTDMSDDQVAQARMELGQYFMTLSGNLVLRLIGNSLRVQIMGHAQKHPSILPMERSDDTSLQQDLDDALAARDTLTVDRIVVELMEANTRYAVATLRAMHSQAQIDKAVNGINL
jgi:DNA-binding FadR family transcriptional regulator